RRSNLVHLEFLHRTLLALAGFVVALDQAALSNHAHSLGEGFGHVLGSLTPDRAAHEQRVAVLPLIALAVKGARRGGNGEVRHGGTRCGEPQFWIGREVSNHRDGGFACHVTPWWLRRTQCASGRMSLV